jgi:hypothetical protein
VEVEVGGACAGMEGKTCTWVLWEKTSGQTTGIDTGRVLITQLKYQAKPD